MAIDMNNILSFGVFVLLIIIGVIGFKELGNEKKNKNEANEKK
jgi:hypothetical protein